MGPYMIFGLLFFVSMAGYSQNTFQKTWGGVWYDAANDISPTLDSNFIITGATYNSSLSCNNILLMKINAMGDTLWTQVYGTSGGQAGRTVLPTSDGGYLVGASAGGLIGSDDIILMKTDLSGNLLWSKMYGGNNYEEPIGLIKIDGMGYLYCGNTGSFGYVDSMKCDRNNPNIFCPAIHLILINETGDTLWTRVIYDKSGAENKISSLKKLKDGKILLVGESGAFNTLGAALLIKIDSTGTLKWSKAYKPKFIEARGVIEKENGNLIVMGNGYWGGGSNPPILYTQGIFIMETDSAGNIKWIKITDDGNDTIQWSDYVMDIAFQNNNYFVTFFPQRGVAGISPIAGIMKIDTSFNILWQKVYGWGAGGLTKSTILPNGSTISATWANELGKGNYDVFIFNTDSDGNSACNTWGMNLTLLDIAPATIQVIDTGFVAGNTNTIVLDYPLQQGYPQLEMMDCDSFVGVQELPIKPSKLTIYPNPSTGELNILYSSSGNAKVEFAVYDLIGKKLRQYELPADKSVYTISDLKLENGVYLYVVSVEREHAATGRIVLIK